MISSLEAPSTSVSGFCVSFHRHPLQGMQQSTFFLKATLSIAAFSNFENIDFALSNVWVCMSLRCVGHHLSLAVSSSVVVFLVYAWLVSEQHICEYSRSHL